jgi:hypothetical protein
MPDDTHKLTALTAIYTATRSDMSSIMNVSMALLGAGAAYIAATLAFADKFGQDVSWIAVILLPSPLWLVAAFHSLLLSISMSHTVTARYAERRLLTHAEVEPLDWHHIGLEAGDRIMNFKRSRWSHAVMDLIIYGGAAALVVAYSIYMLVKAWPNQTTWAVIFGCVYLGAAVSVGFSWGHGFSQVEKSEKTLLSIRY